MDINPTDATRILNSKYIGNPACPAHFIKPLLSFQQLLMQLWRALLRLLFIPARFQSLLPFPLFQNSLELSLAFLRRSPPVGDTDALNDLCKQWHWSVSISDLQSVCPTSCGSFAAPYGAPGGSPGWLSHWQLLGAWLDYCSPPHSAAGMEKAEALEIGLPAQFGEAASRRLKRKITQ